MSTLNMATMDAAMGSASAQNMQVQHRALQNLSASSQTDEAKKAKLREASEGFEAIFIQQMWEEMRASLPQDGIMSSSKEEKFWQGMYDEELAKSMASSGGIGLADMMMEQLEAGITDVAVKPRRTNGLTIAPAPLLANNVTPQNAQNTNTQNINIQNAHVPTAPLLQNIDTKAPIMQAKAAPIMDMNIYEPSTNIKTNSVENVKQEQQNKPSQKIDEGRLNLASSSMGQTQANNANVREVEAGEAIVTTVTYQTNLPESKRQANGTVEQIINQVRENHHTILNEQNSRDVKEAEDFPEMDIIPVQSVQTATRSIFSEPRDILRGIETTYVKYSNHVDTRKAAQSVEQVLLQPTSAGGPDMQKPAPIVETDELAYVNPEENSMAMPLEGNVSSGFGWRLDPYNGKPSWHNGVDVRADAGSAIKSADAGIVTFAGYDEEFGNMIVVEHASGLKTIYAHAQSLNVEAGEAVLKGTEIARVGSSGRASGPHLHFEIRKNDMPINPESVYPQYFKV